MYSVLKALALLAQSLWLVGILLVCFVAPLYLLAIYPELPATLSRGSGRAFSSLALQNFWYRLGFCASLLAMGVAMLVATLRGAAKRSKRL